MRTLFALFLLTGVSFARGDTCALPSTTGFTSNDGNIAVRIEFGRPDAAGAPAKQCIATIARWNGKDRSYGFVRTVVLRNAIGPSEAVITNDARFLVSFDDVCESGMTANAVVIYDLEKGTVVARSLDDFLPKAQRESLHRSISNIDWRGTPSVNNEDRKIWIPPSSNGKADFSVVVDLTNMSITLWPPQPE